MAIVFLFLPMVVCLIVAAITWTRSYLTLSSRLLGWTMVVCAVYLCVSALFNFPYSDPKVLVWSSIGLALLVPMLQFIVILLCWSLHTQRQRFNNTLLLLSLLPALGAFLIMVGYGLIGIDAAADYLENGRMIPSGLTPGEVMMYNTFKLITVDIYTVIVILSVLGCSSYLVYLLFCSDFSIGALFRFLFNKEPLRPLHIFILVYFAFALLSMARLGSDRIFVKEHIVYYCVLFTAQALVLSVLVFLAMRFQRPCVYLSRPHEQPYYDDLPVHVRTLGEEVGTHEFADDESDSYRTLNLRDEMKVVMREEACYLQPGMSRYSVSTRLDVTRPGLDRLVHLLYHVRYEDYVMIQRTEYYRRYRLEYPEESQECVSMACGFQNVSEMNRQIKACRSLFLPIPEDVVEKKIRKKRTLKSS